MSASNLPNWLGYNFPEPVSFAEAAIRNDTSGSTAPRNFTIEHSADWGLTWNVVHGTMDQVAWAG